MNEFEKSLEVDGLALIEDVVFVIWDWEWMHEDFVDMESASGIPVLPRTPPGSEDDDVDGDATPSDCSEVKHTVAFKCIGTTKELRYQEYLARISAMRNKGEEVLCRLKPEPKNPIDSQAIAFESEIDGEWQVIGYIVNEALVEVHEALAANKVIAVSFHWVKYQLYWQAPGWYAGINITRRGKWSPTVMHSRSH